MSGYASVRDSADQSATTACHASSGIWSPSSCSTAVAMLVTIRARILFTCSSWHCPFRCSLVSRVLPQSGHWSVSRFPLAERYSFVAHSTCAMRRLLVSIPALVSALLTAAMIPVSRVNSSPALAHFLARNCIVIRVRTLRSSAPFMPEVRGWPSMATGPQCCSHGLSVVSSS